MSTVTEVEKSDRPKRKSKRSFMQQVKKKFRKGPSISEEDKTDYDYFIRVLKLSQSFEGTLEEKRVFASNALAQTENREVESATNQLKSRVIESLLPLASDDVLEKYFQAFELDLRPICSHQFPSHVLQMLMLLATEHILDNVEEERLEHVEKCKTWLLKVSRFLLNNIEEFVWNTYANPTMRTALLCLAGKPEGDKKYSKIEKETNQPQPRNTPEEFIEVLKKISKHILNWPQFKDLFNNSLTSGYLQTLLLVLKDVDSKLHYELCKKILTCCEEDVASALDSTSSLFLLEAVIEQGKKKLREKIYQLLLKERLVEMATSKQGHMTVQKFINSCSNPEMLDEILSVLKPKFKTILAAGNGEVIVSICQACERLKTGQSEFFKGLLKSLFCDVSDEGKTEMVSAVLSLTPLPHESHSNVKYTRHGSLIVQHLLKFQKPIKIVNSLLAFESEKLAELLSLHYGSFITKAFCESEFVGEKSRLRLIQQLMGHYSFLAQSQFGSRTFDDIWEIADLKNKEKIVEDLNSDFTKVSKSHFGMFVASKVWLELYHNQGREQWLRKIQKIQSKRNMFAEIIGDVK